MVAVEACNYDYSTVNRVGAWRHRGADFALSSNRVFTHFNFSRLIFMKLPCLLSRRLLIFPFSQGSPLALKRAFTARSFCLVLGHCHLAAMSGKQSTLKYVKSTQNTLGSGCAASQFVFHCTNYLIVSSSGNPMVRMRQNSSRSSLSRRRALSRMRKQRMKSQKLKAMLKKRKRTAQNPRPNRSCQRGRWIKQRSYVIRVRTSRQPRRKSSLRMVMSTMVKSKQTFLRRSQCQRKEKAYRPGEGSLRMMKTIWIMAKPKERQHLQNCQGVPLQLSILQTPMTQLQSTK